jgi:DNA (cytosine-5)-methyltransferase 1
MSAATYYNENNSFLAAWLRNLIAAGLIADGVVDDRSIIDVEAADLRGFTQVHLFAGIGGWSHALRLAGWAKETPA